MDLVNYNGSQLPVTFWLDNGTSHSFAFQSPLVVTANDKQYVWTSTTGMVTSQSGTLLVSSFGSIVGNYKTQYYFASSSPYGSPTPANGWFDSGASITTSVGSPALRTRGHSIHLHRMDRNRQCSGFGNSCKRKLHNHAGIERHMELEDSVLLDGNVLTLGNSISRW